MKKVLRMRLQIPGLRKNGGQRRLIVAGRTAVGQFARALSSGHKPFIWYTTSYSQRNTGSLRWKSQDNILFIELSWSSCKNQFELECNCTTQFRFTLLMKSWQLSEEKPSTPMPSRTNKNSIQHDILFSRDAIISSWFVGTPSIPSWQSFAPQSRMRGQHGPLRSWRTVNRHMRAGRSFVVLRW